MATSQMDWDKEVKLEKLEDMITVYEEHIKTLEEENKSLKAQVVFLKEQLNSIDNCKYCTMAEIFLKENDYPFVNEVSEVISNLNL